MCYVEFDDACVTLDDSEIRARKEHTCGACGGVIPPGVTYRRTAWVYEGRVESDRACAFCHELTEEFASEHGGNRPFPNSLRDFIKSCILEGDERSEHWERCLHDMDARAR